MSHQPDYRHPLPGSQATMKNSQNFSPRNCNSNSYHSEPDSKSYHSSSNSGSDCEDLDLYPTDNVLLESLDLATAADVRINKFVMNVPMGCLDFAPIPTAPTAVPVTEHVEINCAPNHETLELTSMYSIPNNVEFGEEFETLRPLDPQDAILLESEIMHQMRTQAQQQEVHSQNMYQKQQQHQHPQNPQLEPQHAQEETPEAQEAEERHSPHQPPQQQAPQDQQYVLLMDQQSQHSPNLIHSPTSNASSSSSQHQLENQFTVSSTSSDDDIQLEHKSLITLIEEIMNEVDLEQTQQQRQLPLQPPQQQQMNVEQDQSSMHGMVVTTEISGMMNQSQMSDTYQSDASENSIDDISDDTSMQYTNDTSSNNSETKQPSGARLWTAEDMELALDALRTYKMGLAQAAATYGIPPTTLWQRAHRLGIDTPKKDGPPKKWNKDSLNSALEALRAGTLSANRASKEFGIPSSSLYKIARREGIRLAVPFNAAPTTWTAKDLDRALQAIRTGQTTVLKASVDFAIPAGTLYGRCRREGIELSRRIPMPKSEDAIREALESVKQGHMTINHAAVHYNVPKSSLYGRVKRGKYKIPNSANSSQPNHSANDVGNVGGNTENISGISEHVTTSASTMADVSNPQLESQKEPPQNEHSPENTVNYRFY